LVAAISAISVGAVRVARRSDASPIQTPLLIGR
jgi:hypothetical protein